MASNQDNFFKIHGAKSLQKELQDLSRGMQNRILRSPMRKAVAEIRKDAKKFVPVESGWLKKSIKSKVFTTKRGSKGIVGRVGVFVPKQETRPNGRKMVHPARVASTLEYGTENAGKARNTYIGARNFLRNALRSADDRAVEILIKDTQKRINEFHAKRRDEGKI